MKVLLVDDSPTILMSLTMLLDREGYEHVTAESAEAALALFDGGLEPDLVITDLNMPGMDGIGLVGAIRRGARAPFVPILLLTTESSPIKRQEARRAGATGWLVKPVDPASLVKVLRQVLARA